MNTNKITKIFPDKRIGLLHGRMKADEKTTALDAFRNKKVDILVATPVVEVGIDIPNATIMVVEGADRFGLGPTAPTARARGPRRTPVVLFTVHRIPMKKRLIG